MITRVELWNSNPHPKARSDERNFLLCYERSDGWEIEDLVDSHEVRITRDGVSMKIYKAHVKNIVEEPEPQPAKAKAKRA
jgi:hypothetical protein